MTEREDGERTTAGRVLVVDDELTVADMVKGILEIRGYEADVASSGAAALELCATREYDLVITDWMMPGMTGVELVRTLQAQGRPERPTVVFMTGSHIEEARAALAEADVFEVLAKPVKLAALDDVVHRALQHHVDRRRSQADADGSED